MGVTPDVSNVFIRRAKTVGRSNQSAQYLFILLPTCAPINDFPDYAGNTRDLGGVLPEIIAQTMGDLPFPNVLVEDLEDT